MGSLSLVGTYGQVGRATTGSLVGTYGQVGSDAHWQHRRRRSCMFEPLLSLNPQFAWMAAAAMDDGDVGGAPWA